MWPVVKELCDHACNEVVLVRCLASGRLLAYCDMCGAAWHTPADLDEQKYVILFEVCQLGIGIPTPEDVAASAWAGNVVGSVPESEYFNAPRINASLAAERMKRPS